MSFKLSASELHENVQCKVSLSETCMYLVQATYGASDWAGH